MSKTIFEKTQKGQRAYSLPKEEKAWSSFVLPEDLLRKQPLRLPEVSELDLMRHFSLLARKNMGIDTHFYPLGSCTMKLNPRVNELCAQWDSFVSTHPLAPEETVQGNLQVMGELMEFLCELSGMSAGSLQPNAGAQGEFVGLRMIMAYHQERGDHKRCEILIPDSAHGTNPASAALCGCTTVSIRSTAEGDLDLEHLDSLLSDRCAGLMLTNPNTLGLFSPSIVEIAEKIHRSGGLLYYDGANLNPILTIAKPGEMGFDVMHLNLHKTFSTPHGGGGPGGGPVLCNDRLKEFLPSPQLVQREGKWRFISESPLAMGRIASFYGNFSVFVRAYLYCRLHGHYGLRKVAEMAVLNANYLKQRLSSLFSVPFPQFCMHEFVLQADRFMASGVRAFDIAKRLLDYGVHPPTVYFPLLVKECMLIEPTETESKGTLDAFVEAMHAIVEEARRDPEQVQRAPHSTPVRRLDEARAARDPVLTATP